MTFAVGTVATDDTNQVAGNTLWHQGALKPAESAGSALVVEMGARLYVPALGRFLQVDPIEGGGANDYAWPTDPINGHDLSGNFAIALPLVALIIAIILLAVYISMPRRPLPPINIDFSWPTIKAPTRKNVTGAVMQKGLTIPVPRPTNYRKDKKYIVYEIFQASTGDTWKYGITSGSPLERRPQSQLATCAAHFGSECGWIRRAENLQGFYQARLVEYSYIVGYAARHGSCPPGQPSCN
ncbi:RHS repeat-associated core domain-containing protein [Microbacterium sp. PMB16]|uniref:RHS repeat-associated core domain-containing protein n=1 Tax=Microbacterium sp. PMB16 TaxID=3120157 RepID=UPI003F4C6627